MGRSAVGKTLPHAMWTGRGASGLIPEALGAGVRWMVKVWYPDPQKVEDKCMLFNTAKCVQIQILVAQVVHVIND